MSSMFTRFSVTPTEQTEANNTAEFNVHDIQENLFFWFSAISASIATFGGLVGTLIIRDSTLPISLVVIVIVLIWLTVFRGLFPYRVRVTLHLLVISALIGATLLTSGLINILMGLLALIILSSMFLSSRVSAIWLTLICSLLLLAGWLIATSQLVLREEELAAIATGENWIASSFTSMMSILSSIIITYAIIYNVQNLLQRQRALTQEIADNRASLEERVREQTKVLELTLQVSRSLSDVLEKQQLIEEVVDQIQSAFNYYHVHIYLWDASNQQLVMAGGTGEVGRTLLIGRHKIPAYEGIVGEAAASLQPVLATNVHENPYWRPNTLLPETKTELAIPIQLGGELLGILDVQNSVVGSLQQQDVQVLTTLANQIANALRNVEIYEQVQEQVKEQATINRIGQKVQLAPKVTFALQTAAQELYESLDANRVGITILPKALYSQEAPPAEEEAHYDF